MINKISSILKIVVGWSLPAKFLITALVSALGGAGVLSYLVEYATYWYAVSYGFRPPVEGIPFLRSTVTLASLILLIAGALLTSIVITSFGGVAKQFDHSGPILSWALKHKSSTGLKLLFACLSLLFLSSYVGYVFASLLCTHNNFTMLCKVRQDDPRIILPPAFALSSLIIFLTVRFPKTVWAVAISYTTIFYISVVIVMFRPPRYAEFLRATGFGGGTAIQIDIDQDKEIDRDENALTFLMLRTATVFFLYKPLTGEIEERPIEKVRRVRYATGSLSDLPHSLPRLKGEDAQVLP